jgi:hypothetical protein
LRPGREDLRRLHEEGRRLGLPQPALLQGDRDLPEYLPAQRRVHGVLRRPLPQRPVRHTVRDDPV